MGQIFKIFLFTFLFVPFSNSLLAKGGCGAVFASSEEQTQVFVESLDRFITHFQNTLKFADPNELTSNNFAYDYRDQEIMSHFIGSFPNTLLRFLRENTLTKPSWQNLISPNIQESFKTIDQIKVAFVVYSGTWGSLSRWDPEKKVFGERNLEKIKETLDLLAEARKELLAVSEVMQKPNLDIKSGETPDHKTHHFKTLEIIEKYIGSKNPIIANVFRVKLKSLLTALDENLLNIDPSLYFAPTKKDLLYAYIDEINILSEAYLNNSSRVLRPEINKPRSLRFESLIEQGQGIVDHLLKLSQELFSSTGFSSLKEFKSVLRKDPEYKRALNDLTSNQFEFAIANEESRRIWVSRSGIQNKHVTEDHRQQASQSERNLVESSRIHSEYDEYLKMNAELKPKYGFLHKARNSKVQNPPQSYGGDFYILKKDKVGGRTTFTIGDSQNGAVVSFIPGYLKKISAKSMYWRNIFLPWSHRELLAPFIGEIYKGSNQTLTPRDVENKELGIDFEYERHGQGMGSFGSGKKGAYFELQFWGPLRLDDVKAFVFEGKPPEGAFLESLQNNNIKIYRRSYNDNNLWTP